MLTTIYYLLKPILPWRVRLALRQWRAERRRKAYADVWPIDPSVSTKPSSWPGWPEGKKFAFVLTHDVEGLKGYERVPKVVELTRRFGFRSSFNFVPKGEYQVNREMLDFLSSSGFETGVHGFEHDGKLYRSKARFAAKAAHIRNTLQSWGACGFRSPLMQHRLPWMHKLGCEYDLSTFDVDPFEPQPDGMATMFPFWVSAGGNSGFVELPYSLVQDFTLFTVLGEKTIDIWKKKLDWIAEHGGMALLNTHPDYMCFNGEPARDEFQVELYEEFLSYAKERYGDCIWHALPREVARYYCENIPVEKRNTRRKVCMIVYSDYEHDSRVRRYAETLAKRGDLVEVISLFSSDKTPEMSSFNGVRVHHIARRDRNESSPWTYLSRHVRFLLKAAAVAKKMHIEKPFDVVHIHNIPDFLVFAAWYPKLTGAKLILDIHDVVPEFFGVKFRGITNRIFVPLLIGVEKLSMKFVDHSIISNHLWRDKLIARSADAEHCSVLINYLNPQAEFRWPKTRNDGKFVVIYPGTFQWHQGLDIAIRAFKEFLKRVPNAEFHIYGRGNDKIVTFLENLVRELGLDDTVKFNGEAPRDSIAQVIANADMGVVPKRADAFGNEAYSSKIMEYMAQGVPVVVARTRIDDYYFTDAEVQFFEPGNSEAMAAAMAEVAENQERRKSIIKNGLAYVARHNWADSRKEYLDLIDDLATEHFEGIHAKPELSSALES